MAHQTKRQIMAGVDGAIAPRIVANNTVRYTRADGATVWRLHNTDVVVREVDGTYTLDSGGWQTVTTKNRINRYTPVQVHSDRGTWYVGRTPFRDGMRVDAFGRPIAELPALSLAA